MIPESNRQRVLLAGATGLIGRALLEQLTSHELYLPCRRPGEPAAHRHWLPLDFQQLDELTLPGRVDQAFCALGTTRQQAGSAAAFRQVDFDYILAFGRLAQRHGCQRLVVVSSLGASARSPSLYLKTKGEMEQALLAQAWPHLTIVRPAMLLGGRSTPRRSEQLSQLIYPLVEPLLRGRLARYRAIEAEQVARAMLRLARENGVQIVENERLHQCSDLLSEEIAR